MKKSKVENVSDIKLDFFLKQNKSDIRVILSPGESSWCDDSTTTKSMILYERKSLIRVTGELDIIEGIEYVQKNLINALQNTIEETKGLSSKKEEVIEETKLTPLEIAKKEVEEYKQAPEKKYTGKKRGRKKKRGPKPGAKKAASKKAASKKTDLTEKKESDKTEE